MNLWQLIVLYVLGWGGWLGYCIRRQVLCERKNPRNDGGWAAAGILGGLVWPIGVVTVASYAYFEWRYQERDRKLKEEQEVQKILEEEGL